MIGMVEDDARRAYEEGRSRAAGRRISASSHVSCPASISSTDDRGRDLVTGAIGPTC